MATAKEMLDAGKLQPAIEELTREVKKNPTDMQKRTFLFELLCFSGDWTRAERQLQAIGQQSVKAEIGVQVYLNNIKAEQDRRRLFSDGLQPHFLSEPPVYVDLHLAAINRLREGNIAEACELLDRAEEERPSLSGRLNGRQFLDFRDYNDLIGPVLELIVQEKYTWLPFEQIKQIEIAAPKQLRDLIWATARIETTTGTIGEVYIPTLYVGSSENPNDQVKLGRMTEWEKISDNLHYPTGLRLFLVDYEDKAILEMRTIEFDPVATEAQLVPSVLGAQSGHSDD